MRIAAELGVSEASVRQRVARLVGDGVMAITAVTNPLKLGFDVVCLIGLNVEQADRWRPPARRWRRWTRSRT